MTLYVDPPAWPAHDRLWSHLVSDSSLHELRTFARAQGLPDRSFDLDHYDVPADRHDDLVAAGALAVSGGDLARRLGASVLRVPGRERRGASRPALLARWAGLWPEPTASVRAAGAELVGRWREPHRVYHSRLHLADALDALDTLVSGGAPGSARLAALALWFHDAVHDGEAGRDEERSAALAVRLLAPLATGARGARGTGLLAADDVDEVARLVLVTADHDPAHGDATGALVSDADLAVLGGEPRRYARYAAQVRAEYGHVPDDAFRTGRSAVLDELLARLPDRLPDRPGAAPTLFRSAAGAARWSGAAGRNLRAERASLTD
ncbi:DUF4031 domain-containing protein [Isoptericola sp. NEAU-Y5]|uniref:DUF4031 domain-containing protein n=1 Tax=Isoptericola luteus TaxID=2879484 RepID=A0ABS7ZCF9_9MICO|nr:DUF4031 domain-containing protein [Isoptericola sp. NEAU-Y5]MCA5892603.1 DUF4031 domain-containing protein [Isoptericola sp. NEAU-Y5]